MVAKEATEVPAERPTRPGAPAGREVMEAGGSRTREMGAQVAQARLGFTQIPASLVKTASMGPEAQTLAAT